MSLEKLKEDHYSKAERDEMIRKMKEISSLFYPLAAATHVHAFIEFTGLMNEFITVCEQAQAAGQDFTRANTHTGQCLPIQTHHAAYLAEKLNCIYGPSLLSRAQIRDTFISVLFEGAYQLVPTVHEDAPEPIDDKNVKTQLPLFTEAYDAP